MMLFDVMMRYNLHRKRVQMMKMKKIRCGVGVGFVQGP